MSLTDRDIQEIKSRRDDLFLLSNEGLISDLVEMGFGENPIRHIRMVLGLLEGMGDLSRALIDDVDVLLKEISELKKLLEVYDAAMED
ncbi:MAG: hypothetical protein QW303_03335 [Nitrososphaerota archaeon]